jgi:hypothetical protein
MTSRRSSKQGLQLILVHHCPLWVNLYRNAMSEIISVYRPNSDITGWVRDFAFVPNAEITSIASGATSDWRACLLRRGPSGEANRQATAALSGSVEGPETIACGFVPLT